MQELSSWRVLLGQLIHDPQERNRIANELGINPATLVRWAHNETNPRPQNLSQLLKVVASANRQKLQESIAEEFPEFGIKVNEEFTEDTSIEIPSGTYSSVLHTYITAPKRQRFWLVSNLILQEALRQLDPNLLGMTVSIAQCVKPQEGKKVRSLREYVGRGTHPWKATMKHGLRTTISAGLMPTFATGLRGMARVNLDHTDTTCLGFVLDKRVQLGKAPTMQAPFVLAFLTVLLPTSHVGSLANVLEVFKHDGSAFRGVLDNAFGEDMVMVSVSPKLFAAQLLEMSLGRAAAFGLQFSFEAKGTSFLLLPSLLTQELTSRGDSRAIESQVNANHFSRCTNGRFRERYNDMERIASLALTQIGTTDLLSNVLHEVSRYREGQFNAPIHRSETTGHGIPLNPVRALVIADSCQLTIRAANRLESRNRLALFPGFLNLFGVYLLLPGLPGQCRFHGFCGLDTGRADQLCRKVRVLCSQRIVRAFVQLYAIATRRGKALLGHGIKAGSMLLKGCLECMCLFWRWIELYHHRTFHAESISYIMPYCQRVCASGDARCFLPVAEAGGLHNGGFDEALLYGFLERRLITL